MKYLKKSEIAMTLKHDAKVCFRERVVKISEDTVKKVAISYLVPARSRAPS